MNLNGLKVCYLAGTLTQGGAERQLYYALRALVASGASPRLLCLTRGEYWEQPIRALGVPVTWVGREQSFRARLGAIIDDLRTDRPAILQSQHFYTNLYLLPAARRLGLPEIGAIRNDVFSEIRGRGAIARRVCLHLLRRIAANSQAAIRNAHLLGVPDGRLHLLPNVVDTAQFLPASRCEGPVHILSAGRLVPQKRFDRLLEGLAALRDSHGNRFRATIAGSGPLNDELQQYALSLGLKDHVRFLPAVSDMRALYAESDIFALTSDHEGTPNVLLEALACGLAVIATRVGGVPETIAHDRTGLLVNPLDERSLTRSLAQLIDDGELRGRLGGAARSYTQSQRSVEALPAALSAIYAAAL